MTQFSWNCRQVDAYPSYESEADVVYNVHWILDAERTEGEDVYTASVYGTQSIAIDLSDFVPFDELTNEMVSGWVIDAMGEEEVQSKKDALNLSIDNQINPTSIALTIEN
jgi:hypothetical protein